jgi:hypothetical protein
MNKIEVDIIIFFINKMDKSESVLIQVPFNKLVLKRRYMIETTNGLMFTGTYYYMFGPTDIVGDLLGLGQPTFIDFKPEVKGKSMLMCSAYDKFYDLKIKIE